MKEYLTHQLDSVEIPVALGEYVFDKPVIVEEKYINDKVHFKFGVNGSTALELFNDENDFADATQKLLGTSSDTLLKFEPSHAWLLYSAGVEIKTNSGIDVNNLGFGFSAERKIETKSLRKHNPSLTLKEALTTDVVNFKTIFSAKQIKGLAIGEGVSMSFGGILKVSVTVKWTDVFSSSLSTFNSISSSLPILKIKIGAEASASFRLTIQDQFEALIVRKDSSKVYLQITKGKTSTSEFSIKASLGAEIENSKEFAEVIGRLLEGIIGVAENKVKAIISKPAASVSESDKQTLYKIAERLGWDVSDNFLKKFKAKYDALIENLRKKLIDLAELKVSMSFGYDYARIKTKEVLFKAELSEKGIDEFHPEIIRMNVVPLITAVKEKNKHVSNASILNTEILKTSSAIGFSLGFGNWKAYSENTKSLAVTVLENEEGKKIAYDAKRAYKDAAGKDSRNWNMDLQAEMTSFSSNTLANNFDYGLYLGFEQTENKLTLSEAKHVLDMACTWGIIPQAMVHEKANDWMDQVSPKKSITLSCEMKISPLGFEPLLIGLLHLLKRDDLVAFALAKALPPWKEYASRNAVEERTRIYAPLWKQYLLDDEQLAQLYADAAYRSLKKLDPALAVAERDYKQGTTKFDAFGFILNANPRTATEIKMLTSGIERLVRGNDANSTLSHEKVIEQAFKEVQSFWRFFHHFKTLGVMLGMVIQDMPLVKPYVTRTVKITYSDKSGKEQMELLG